MNGGQFVAKQQWTWYLYLPHQSNCHQKNMKPGDSTSTINPCALVQPGMKDHHMVQIKVVSLAFHIYISI